MKLAIDIGRKWRDLARALNFNQATIDVIEIEKIHCAKECCIEVLVSWLRQEGKKATAEKLAEALDEIGLRNVADRIPYKPSDPNQNFVAEIRDLEEDARQKARIKELEEVEARLRARIRELEHEAVTFKATVIELENERQQKGEEARESHVREILEKCKKELNILVTQPLQVPEVRQNNLLRPEVKADVLQVVSERLEELYNITLGIAPEACRCSEALRERFFNFAYDTLQTENTEMNHKYDDVKKTLKKMPKDGKKEFKKLTLLQNRRKDLLVKLEKLRPLFSSCMQNSNIRSWSDAAELKLKEQNDEVTTAPPDGKRRDTHPIDKKKAFWWRTMKKQT